MLDFGDELAAVKANCADSRPAPLDADVTDLDVAFLDARLPLPLSALDSLGAEVVWLKFHLRRVHSIMLIGL